ncbi:MAG TPA: NfeD family protein [Thermoleophilaceae bacterium]|nr:NfeD family protein [Thermoleophilaceae bacterium]
MPDWVLWMIAAGALAVGEIFTLSFFLGPIAVAALVTAGVAALGVGVALQIIVFALVSVATVGVLRPVARRHLRTPSQLRSGTAALVGEHAVVLERVDRDSGQVKLVGETWSARAFDDDEVMEPGAQVQVMQIRGATALVTDGMD